MLVTHKWQSRLRLTQSQSFCLLPTLGWWSLLQSTRTPCHRSVFGKFQPSPSSIYFLPCPRLRGLHTLLHTLRCGTYLSFFGSANGKRVHIWSQKVINKIKLYLQIFSTRLDCVRLFSSVICYIASMIGICQNISIQQLFSPYAGIEICLSPPIAQSQNFMQGYPI